MRNHVLSAILAAGALMLFASDADAQRKSVSAAEVTGTFRMNFTGKFRKFANEAKIQALGGGKIRFALDLVYPFSMQNGEPMVNMGGLDAEAAIKGDKARYVSEGGKCEIVFHFVKRGELRIEQTGSDGACGFGHNVFATGTYSKTSGRRPNFESED